MNRVLFRVDGSFELGMGHIFRCISFAEGLNRIGIESIFSIKGVDKKVKDIVELSGFKIREMPKSLSLMEDAAYTIKTLKKESINFLILDIAHSKNLANLEQFEKYLKKLIFIDKFIVSIDDISQINLPYDIRIVPYYGAEKYFNKESSKSKLLLGPKYFIFNKEFVEAAMIKRVIVPRVTKILITTGGSDPFGLTSLIIQDIYKIVNNNALSVRIVIGPNFSKTEKQKIKNNLQYFKTQIELIDGGPDKMAQLMLWADVAIISGGLTKYETTVTGTPTITISPFEREAEMVSYFEKGGSLINLGLMNNLKTHDIAFALNKYISDQKLRIQMSENGKSMLDTNGVYRIINEIQNSIKYKQLNYN